jgi:sulfur carrier protein
VTSQTIEITVNGDRLEFSAEQTVQALLSHLRLVPDRVAVELNKRIVPKAEWRTTQIESGATIEIVQFVGGG